jgi:hypothetical protein
MTRANILVIHKKSMFLFYVVYGLIQVNLETPCMYVTVYDQRY